MHKELSPFCIYSRLSPPVTPLTYGMLVLPEFGSATTRGGWNCNLLGEVLQRERGFNGFDLNVDNY